jgi:hypothetical protein
MTTKRLIWWLVADIVVALFIGLVVGYNRGVRHCQELPHADTIVVERIDTVTLTESRVDSLIRVVERLRPVTQYDTIVRGDTLYVQLPYEYRYYGKPDTLEIWYSGVDPRIDSARIYNRHTTEIIKQPYEVVKMPRMTIGVGCGAFYNDGGVNPYLVGEMRYNAPRTTFGAYGGIDHQGRWGVGANVTYRMNIIK